MYYKASLGRLQPMGTVKTRFWMVVVNQDTVQAKYKHLIKTNY